jgi:hypothetical protein
MPSRPTYVYVDETMARTLCSLSISSEVVSKLLLTGCRTSTYSLHILRLIDTFNLQLIQLTRRVLKLLYSLVLVFIYHYQLVELVEYVESYTRSSSEMGLSRTYTGYPT